jgi:tRNA(His) 5'-end guanylyltransferase
MSSSRSPATHAGRHQRAGRHAIAGKIVADLLPECQPADAAFKVAMARTAAPAVGDHTSRLCPSARVLPRIPGSTTTRFGKEHAFQRPAPASP